jgi:aminopeptidase N
MKPEEDETTWWIPLGLAEAKNVALTTKEETIRDADDTFYKLNTDNIGFYRTNYPRERLARLGKAQDRLSVEDKIGLIGDAAALAIAGDGTTAGLLAFVEGFKDESDYL